MGKTGSSTLSRTISSKSVGDSVSATLSPAVLAEDLPGWPPSPEGVVGSAAEWVCRHVTSIGRVSPVRLLTVPLVDASSPSVTSTVSEVIAELEEGTGAVDASTISLKL